MGGLRKECGRSQGQTAAAVLVEQGTGAFEALGEDGEDVIVTPDQALNVMDFEAAARKQLPHAVLPSGASSSPPTSG